MNCYNHPNTVSVGTCKACGKGLCPECLTDLGHGLACKNKHESDVENYKLIMDKSIRIYKAAPKNSIIAPLFYLFMGFVFAGFGYFSRGGITDLPFILGVGFIIFGIVIFIRNKAIFNKEAA